MSVLSWMEDGLQSRRGPPWGNETRFWCAVAAFLIALPTSYSIIYLSRPGTKSAGRCFPA